MSRCILVVEDQEDNRQILRDLLAATDYEMIEPGSPWENGYCESFNGKLRDECLNREIFYSLREAQLLIEQWRIFYNTERPHSSLGYRPPAPSAIFPPPTLTAYAAPRANQSQAQVHAGY